MSDLDRIREALESSVWPSTKWRSGVVVVDDSAFQCITDVTRRYVGGQSIQWCETHNAQMVSNGDHECWDADRPHHCSAVPRWLSQPPGEEET